MKEAEEKALEVPNDSNRAKALYKVFEAYHTMNNIFGMESTLDLLYQQRDESAFYYQLDALQGMMDFHFNNNNIYQAHTYLYRAFQQVDLALKSMQELDLPYFMKWMIR